MNKFFFLMLFFAGTLAHAQAVERMSTIISGKLSISGSTNRSALNDQALKKLCEEGFTLALFTYPGARTRSVNCGGGRSLSYQSISDWENPSAPVAKISDEVNGGGRVS